MQFSAPLADARNYPLPIIKALPTQRQLTNNGEPRGLAPNIANRWITDHARSALYLLAKSLESKVIWVPTYHCPALIEPFLAANKQIKLYPLTATLLPDYEYLRQHHQPEEAVVGVRFFGFDCGISELADFCRNSHSLLIEDLAHAAFFDRLIGHAAVTSLVKFYPVKIGAELLLNESWPNADKVQRTYQKLPNNGLEKLNRFINKIANKIIRTNTKSQFRYFNLQSVSRNIPPDDLAIIHGSAQQDIIAKRRNNYQSLANGLKISALGEVLFTTLADNTVPYVLPFLLHGDIKKSAASFDFIRQQGIQIYRWEELAFSECQISQDYRHRLIQLPVHQDLTEQQLDFIIHVFTTHRDT